MSADAIALLLITGFTGGLTIFSVFMFMFAMTPPIGSPEFSPSPYQPMDVLTKRGAQSKKAPAQGEVSVRHAA
ncbi:MAG: hypothetical protein LBQ09_08440 [Acidobacteriaceae bacterium]|jgi:hypothetical protein|nr:hypothetical protein [Acidobacteriaceae bacterium]